MTRLSCAGLGWATGGRFVFADVALALQPATLTVVTGANGAGKSSLIRLLAGDHRPSRGSIALDHVPLERIDPRHLARRIARLDHAPGLYLDLSARENLALFQTLLGRDPRPAEVEARLGAVGIGARDADRPVRGFSRGMLQRTALARVIGSAADVWLLDEPSAGLDASGTATLCEVLMRERQRGTAVLAATHDPALAALADVHLRLEGGRLAPAERA